MIGKNSTLFPTIGQIFSNHWKTCAAPRSQRIVPPPEPKPSNHQTIKPPNHQTVEPNRQVLLTMPVMTVLRDLRTLEIMS